MIVLGLAATWPRLTAIGATRMLLPWAGAEWPKRTELADATPRAPHPLGTALPLRAALVRSDRAPEATRVAAVYRVLTAGRPGPERRVLLTAQSAQAAGVDAAGSPASGTLFERLIEPAGLAPPAAQRAGAPAPTELQYWFETDDDRTPPRTLALVEPPAVLHAAATVTLPPYAGALLGESAGSGPQHLDLGAGADDRAAPAPILVGSQVVLTLEFNKPLAAPTNLDPKADDSAFQWLATTLGPDAPWLFSRPTPPTPPAPPAAGAAAPETDPLAGLTPGATLSADGRTWTLRWRHWDSVRLVVRPTDEHAIPAADEAVFRLDVLKDNPPTATVTLPTEDKSVLPTASVELTAEGRDDVGLTWVALERQLARKPSGSEGAPTEAEGPRTEILRQEASAAAPADAAGSPTTSGGGGGGIKRLLASTTLDLSTIEGLKPGDELWITALAADAFELDGRRHEPVRSGVRRLKILSRQELVEQIWSELSALRRTAIKIDQDQAETAKLNPQPGPAGEEAARRVERAQAGLTERLSRQTGTLDRLKQRARENALADPALDKVLEDARSTLQRAGEKSARASQDLGQAAQKQGADKAPPDAGRDELRAAADEQKGVRDELSDLIDMLDQGEDSFASKRSLERVLQQQKDLEARTQEAGRTTAGKRPDQLSPQQRQELDRLAQEQDAAAKDLRDAVRKMQERAQKLSKTDPAGAQAMEQAARQSQRDQTPERMEQAAQQARQNQTSQAQEQQARAVQSLEQMLGQLQQGQKNRDEVLRRYLASLIESIRALAERQRAEIAALNAAVADGGGARVSARETPMAALHQSTLGVLEEAGSGPREAAPVSERLEAAADAMAAAIPDLRASTPDAALRHETDALDHLTRALEIAQKADEDAADRQADQKREDLRKRYLDAYAQQVSLRDAAQDLAGQEAGRRTRAAARLVAQDQTTLRDAVAKIREETRELAEVKVFDFAHTRLDGLMQSAADRLAEGAPDAQAVAAQTSAARLLKSLADALDKSGKKPDEPFRKGENGGGGGGGGSQQQPLVPAAAEVTLLKLMQQEALDLTRAAADAPAPDPAAIDAAGKLQRDLADQGRALLKKLEKKSGGAVPGATPKGKPSDKPDEPDDADKPDPVKPDPDKPTPPAGGDQ
jgi:hypothetical protein